MPEEVVITFEDGSIKISEDIDDTEDLPSLIDVFSPYEESPDRAYDELALADALTRQINTTLGTPRESRLSIFPRNQLVAESINLASTRAKEYEQRAAAAKKAREFQQGRDLSAASVSQKFHNIPNLGQLVRSRMITAAELFNYLFLTWGLEYEEYKEMTQPYNVAETLREHVFYYQSRLNCSIILNLAIQNVSLSRYLTDREAYIADSNNLLLLTARALQTVALAQRVDRLAEVATILSKYIPYHFETDDYEDPLYRNMLYLAKAIGLEVAADLQQNPHLFCDIDLDRTEIARFNAKSIANMESATGLLPDSLHDIATLLQALISKTWNNSWYKIMYDHKYSIGVRSHLLPGDPIVDNIAIFGESRSDTVLTSVGNMANLLLEQIESLRNLTSSVDILTILSYYHHSKSEDRSE